MTLLLNVDSGRELREGDHIRLSSSGVLGRVVGVDVLSEAPLVIQRKDGRLSQHSANDVVLLQEGTIRLEPLPPIVQVIQEGKLKDSYRTCASMLCISLLETPVTFTLVPKTPVKLKSILEASIASKTFGEAVLDVLQAAFVSRLPHLVDFESTADKAA